jgi:hypothetical protein
MTNHYHCTDDYWFAPLRDKSELPKDDAARVHGAVGTFGDAMTITKDTVGEMYATPGQVVIPQAMHELAKQHGIDLSGYAVSEQIPVSGGMMKLIKSIARKA